MGLLCASMSFSKHMTTKSFSNLLYHLKLLFVASLAGLGLLKRSPLPRRPEEGGEEPSSSSSSSSFDLSYNTVLIMDGSCPMLVPVHVVTSMIKSRIPVVEFGKYLEKRGCRRRDDEGEECPVCLGVIERSDEIREPSNCDHVFHRECLDRWIGEYQVTCPLCRCMLLPVKRSITFC